MSQDSTPTATYTSSSWSVALRASLLLALVSLALQSWEQGGIYVGAPVYLIVTTLILVLPAYGLSRLYRWRRLAPRFEVWGVALGIFGTLFACICAYFLPALFR